MAASATVAACGVVRGGKIDVGPMGTDSTTAAPAPGPPEFTLVGAGDIASCAWRADDSTAALLDSIAGVVFTLGDNVYESGTPAEFARCFAPTWGRHRDRIQPSIGNHEYGWRDGEGYFGYYGAAAGPDRRGYYSYELGAWHVVVLNTATDIGPASPQLAWLRADLAAHPSRCLLAYGHHPRFSSGRHGGDPRLRAVWDVLYAARADIILGGHDHVYERFAPQSPAGRADPERGIRQFVVGTGGAPLYRVRGRAPTSEVVNNVTHGVLVLTLRDGSYRWRFVPARGARFTDQGRGECHGRVAGDR